MTADTPSSAARNRGILRIEELRVEVVRRNQSTALLRAVSAEVPRSGTLALVGESGSGKTMVAASVLRILPERVRITGGRIWFYDQDVVALPERAMRRIRGNRIGMVFQEAGNALNPLMTVGAQVAEQFIVHKGLSKKAAREQAIALLEMVGIDEPRRRFGQFPHVLSTGAKQRVMIAMALACHPPLLLADEPTSSLDPTVQAQIVDLLARLRGDLRMSLLLISHDIAVVDALADQVAVLCQGVVVEQVPARPLWQNAMHPYTRDFLQRTQREVGPVTVSAAEQGCPFALRCPLVQPVCTSELPGFTQVASGHWVRCFALEKRSG